VLTGLLCIGCTILLTVPAHAAGPTPEQVDEVQVRLAQARQALTSPDSLLDEGQRQSLGDSLRKADAALEHYMQLSKQGEKRARVAAPLSLAGVALVADDASGIGAADDLLLPFIGLGLLATHLLTEAPAPRTEIDKAWQQVLVELRAVAQVAAQLKASTRYVPPPRTLPGFPDAELVSPKTPLPGLPGKLRKRWRSGKKILEWDYQHGRVEAYDKNGNHLGEFDPNTGQQTKNPDPSRKIKP
jgi:hypothetical protein